MATVGNLFVNVGASTRGLETGLKKAQTDVNAFANKAKSSLQGMEISIPGLNGVSIDMGKIIDKAEALRKGFLSIGSGAKAAAEQTKKLAEAITASKAADQALASAKGARKNIGMARSMLASQGIDPNKAVAALKIEDTSALRKKIGEAIIKQTDAEKKLAGAQLFAAKAAKGRDPYTGQILSAANKIKVAELATKELTKAQENVTAAVQTTTKAHAALAAVQKSNRDKEATRGKLGKMGIDLSKGQGALKLPSLSGFQSAAAAAKSKVTDITGAISESAKAFKIFGMPLGTAAGLLTGVGVAAVGAVVGLLALTRSQAAAMDALSETATSAGMSVEAYQKLEHTYKDLGASSGAAVMASQRLGITLDQAAQGSEEARDKISRLGITYEQLANKSPDEALQATIGKIRELGSHRERMAALRDMFGKGGLGLAAAVNATAESFKEASDRAAKLVIPSNVVQDLAAVNDKVDAAGASFSNMMTMLAHSFAPVLESLADSIFTMFTVDTSGFVSAFQSVSVVLAVVYDLIAFVVNAFMALWNVVQALAEVLNTGVMAACYGILKIAEWLVKAFDFLTGTTSELGSHMAEAAALAFEGMKQSASDAGDDVGEALQRSVDAVKPDAAMAMMASLTKGMESTKREMEGNPISIEAKLSEKSLKEANSILSGLQAKIDSLSIGEDQMQINQMKGIDPTKVKDVETLQAKLKALEAEHGIMKDIAEIDKQILDITGQTTAEVVAGLVASGASVESATKLVAKQEELARARAKDADQTAIKGVMDDLLSKNEEMGKSEAELLQIKMKKLHAGDEEIKQAMALLQTMQTANIDASMESHFKNLNDRLLEAQGNERELLKNQLANIGLAGDALEKAVNDTIAIEDKIDAEKKKTDNAMTVKDTMQDLADQLEAMKLGESGMLQKKLEAAGADTTQVAEALAMFAEIQAGSGAAGEAAAKSEQQAQGFVDSIDTALGSFKTQGSMGADSIDKQLVAQGDKQTTLLASIANNTAAISPTGGTGLMAAGATTSTLPVSTGMARQTDETTVLLKESNTYLKAIASNTAAFAGVLT
jgi:hypothetical protein